ncbi:hypothetical protein D3C85_1860850 [compost metagenome]
MLVCLVARELVQAGDDQILILEVVPGRTLLHLLAAEDLELDAELFQQLVLPLLSE